MQNLEKNIKNFLDKEYPNGFEIYIDYNDYIDEENLFEIAANSSDYAEFLMNTRDYVLDLYSRDDYYAREALERELIQELESIYDGCDFCFSDLYEDFSDLINEYEYFSIDDFELKQLTHQPSLKHIKA